MRLYNKQFMSQELRRRPREAHYNHITYKKRLELISLVQQDNYTISQAALTLQIKLSTAKLIIARFRKTKTIFRRKSELPNEKKPQKKKKSKNLQKVSLISNDQAPESRNNEASQPKAQTAFQNQGFQNYPLVYVAPWQLFQELRTNYAYF